MLWPIKLVMSGCNITNIIFEMPAESVNMFTVTGATGHEKAGISLCDTPPLPLRFIANASYNYYGVHVSALRYCNIKDSYKSHNLNANISVK